MKLKNREDGGHTIFKYARSFEGYSEATYSYAGKLTEALCGYVAAGMIIKANLAGDKGASPELQGKLGAALASPKCRVSDLK